MEQEPFTPQQIDEHIDNLINNGSEQAADKRLIQSLYRLSQRDQRIIDKVRERLQEQIAGSAPPPAEQKKRQSNPRQKINPSRSSTRSTWQVLAAVLIVGLCLASILPFIMFERSRFSGAPTPGKTPTTIAEQKLYVLTDEGVYKIDQQKWRTLWYYPIDREQWQVMHKPITVANGLAYVSVINLKSQTSYMIAIDIRNGKERWRQVLDMYRPITWQIAQGMLYISTSDNEVGGRGQLYALDAVSGQKQWNRETIGAYTIGAIQTQVLYIVANERIYALSSQDGHEIWKSSRINATFTGDPLLFNGVLYSAACFVNAKSVADPQCDYYAYAQSDGTLLWKTPEQIEGTMSSPPRIVNKLMYFGVSKRGIGTGAGESGSIYTLDITQQGKLIWKRPIGRATLCTPTGGADTLYAGETSRTPLDNHLIALYGASGQIKWSQQIDGLTGCPITHDGLIYQSVAQQVIDQGNAIGVQETIQVRNPTDGTLLKKYVISQKGGESMTVAFG